MTTGNIIVALDRMREMHVELKRKGLVPPTSCHYSLFVDDDGDDSNDTYLVIGIKTMVMTIIMPQLLLPRSNYDGDELL